VRPDERMFESGEIEIPFADVGVDYAGFLYFSPVFLALLVTYLHVFVEAWARQRHAQPPASPPWIFNLHGLVPSIVSFVMLYLLPAVLLGLFAWKALPLPHAPRLVALAFGTCGALSFLYMRRVRSGRSVGTPVCLVVTAIAAVAVYRHNDFARSLFLERVDLSGKNLDSYRMPEAWLMDAKLEKTTFRNADLRKARLRGAALQGANLSDAKLSECSLAGANLTGAYLVGADLSGCSLVGAILHNANLADVDLRRATLTDAVLTGANLQEADLRGVADLTCEQLLETRSWLTVFPPANLATQCSPTSRPPN
jgi:hypothetical protein